MDFTKKISHKHHKFIKILVLTLTVFLAVLTISSLVEIQNKIKQGRYIGAEIETKNTISVSGKGEVYAKPDLALTSFTVKTEKKTVASAMSENTKKMNAIIETIKKAGVDKKDLKTISFNMYPRYEYREEAVYQGRLPVEGRRILVGYEVSQSLQVKIRDMEKIGDIIQRATSAGANQAGGLQFTIDDIDGIKEEARGEAIDDAKLKAKKIAKQLGVDLVRIVSFGESGGQIPRYDYAMKTIAMDEAGGGELPNIETGENKIEVNVSISYEIQ